MACTVTLAAKLLYGVAKQIENARAARNDKGGR